MSRPWPSGTRALTGVVAWLVAVVAATAAGITAVNAIGSGMAGEAQRPLTQSEVVSRLPASPSTNVGVGSGTTASQPTPTTPSSSAAPAPGEPRVIPTPGGTVIARCTAGGPVVIAATPAQGYQLATDRHGDDHVSVKFRSGRSEVEVELRCVDGSPQPDISLKG